MEKIVTTWTKSSKEFEDLESLIELCDTELLDSNITPANKVELLFHRFLFDLARVNSDRFSIITKILSKKIVCSKIDDSEGIIQLFSNLDNQQLGYCIYYHTRRTFKIRNWELESWDKLINYYENEEYTIELFEYIIDNL